jgi:RNA polymerase sigma factor (sigma-70 family)
MNERRTDFELLREFTRHGDQESFATVVRRHIDLVYATALRKLEDPGAAEEVAQNVFAALAKKAWQFAPDDSLPAWLYRTALLEAKEWLRWELRRRRREQAAAELGTTMKSLQEESTFRALLPLLDEALLSLREKDRTALLLRFFESRSLREVGASLGVGEDAAQKRVAGALEKLAGFFRRRGFRTATVVAAAEVLQGTATTASATATAAVTQAAMRATPPALTGMAAWIARAVGLTKGQTAALCLALVAGPAVWQWNETRLGQRDSLSARLQLDGLRAQADQLSVEIERLRAELVRLSDSLATAASTQDRDKEAESRLATLKTRIFGLLTGSDYRWPDDLPFIRVPKSALREINPGQAFDTAGKLQDWGVEVLGMTPGENQRIEQIVQDYLQGMIRLITTRAYETNDLPNDLANRWGKNHWKTIAVPALSEEARLLADVMVEQLGQTLGTERANLLMGDAVARNARLYSWLGDCLNFTDEPQIVTVCIDLTNADGIECQIFKSGSRGSSGGGWRFGNKDTVRLFTLPDAVNRQFFDPWLRQLGITHSLSQSAP